MRRFVVPSSPWLDPLRTLVLAVLLLSPFLARADSAPDRDRPEWLRDELYAYNHRWAAQAPGELATKMAKMRADPFAFLRGTAHLFHRDMARLPAARHFGQEVLLNGDAHLANFGCSADAEGRAVFALNDFDEAAPGPAAWELRRLATSLVLLGRGHALTGEAQADTVDAMQDAYLERMRAFAAGEAPRRFRLERANTEGEVRECIEDAEKRQRAKWLDKYSRDGKGPRAFKDSEELVVPSAAVREAVLRGLAAYAKGSDRGPDFFKPKDLRQKLGSGVGSLGRLRYWALVEGPERGDDDDLILELKQAAPSSLRPDARVGQGRRVLNAIRAQLAAPDPLAGVVEVGGVEYVMREKSPWQEDLSLNKLDSPKKLRQVAIHAGAALAQAHALASPDRVKALAMTPPRVAQAELRAFAASYADQVERDWRTFRTGRPESFY